MNESASKNGQAIEAIQWYSHLYASNHISFENIRFILQVLAFLNIQEIFRLSSTIDMVGSVNINKPHFRNREFKTQFTNLT